MHSYLPKLTLSILAASVFVPDAWPHLRQVDFDHYGSSPLAVEVTADRQQAGVVFLDITYRETDGSRNTATVVTPKSPTASRPGLLFVHWYEPEASTSNRSQFVPDALALAKAGAVSLLIDTPWSRPEYFQERTREGDYARSIRQVKEFRRALDLLLAQPVIDPERVAFVGHDFGAMYGALAAGVDERVRAFVFMAGTRSFSDWFLYGKPKLEGEARKRFVSELAPLDPIRYLPRLTIPVLFQFARHDIHVPQGRADALAAAAREPKIVFFYDSGHGLNSRATDDRIVWLKKELKIE